MSSHNIITTQSVQPTFEEALLCGRYAVSYGDKLVLVSISIQRFTRLTRLLLFHGKNII